MEVRAKHQVAYKGKLYLGGDVFEIEVVDLTRYLNDVDVIQKSKVSKEKTKPVRAIRTKTK